MARIWQRSEYLESLEYEYAELNVATGELISPPPSYADAIQTETPESRYQVDRIPRRHQTVKQMLKRLFKTSSEGKSASKPKKRSDLNKEFMLEDDNCGW